MLEIAKDGVETASTRNCVGAKTSWSKIF